MQVLPISLAYMGNMGIFLSLGVMVSAPLSVSVFTFLVVTGSLPPHQSCTEEGGMKIS